MVNLFYQIFLIACKIQDKINESNISISQIENNSKPIPVKVSKQSKRGKISTVQIKDPILFFQLKKEDTQKSTQIINEKQEHLPQVVSVDQPKEINKSIEKKLNLTTDKLKQTIEQETENENEINHGNLSEITSVRDEQKIQLQVYFRGVTKQQECNLAHFDTVTTEFLEKTYTQHQIVEIQIHILLNLYEGNEDMNFKLWCLQKILQFVF